MSERMQRSKWSPGFEFRGRVFLMSVVAFASVLLITMTAVPSFAEFPHQCPSTFTYDDGGVTAQQVLVSGSFNDWAGAPPQAYAMTDENGDGTWEVTVSLPIGTYLYKYVVDGNWIADPANPDRSPDGFGGYNSVVHVDCAYPKFTVATHSTDQGARRFQATVGLTRTTADLDAGSVAITLDHQPVAGTSWSVANNIITIDIQDLTDGIHDVRAEGNDLDGNAIEMAIMQVYENVSTDWHDATLYFAMTDRFVNGNPGNDAPIQGVPFKTNYQGGDFQGILDKIEAGYFDSLGVSAIWISWPGDNAEGSGTGSYGNTDQCGLGPGQAGVEWINVEFSAYHGYWPCNLYETENRFGTMDELKQLVDAAHSHGIRILLDLVINHVHSDSPYFAGSPDYFFHYPIEICQDSNWQHPITCWFTSFLPDLNYSDPRVRNDFLNLTTWWAKQTGCDGFRVDALKHVEMDLITGLRQRMQQEMEQTGVTFYLVGETFSGNASDLAYFLGTDKVEGEFDFPLNLQILNGLAWEYTGLNAMHSAGHDFFNVYGSNALMSTFIGNHDIARFVSAAAGQLYCGPWDSVSHSAQGWRHPPDNPTDYFGYQKLQLAMTYILTLPGIPLIYYGDEYGMPGGGDPDNRRMMEFGNDLTNYQQQTLAYTQLIGSIRKGHPALRASSWPQDLWSDTTFLVYSRVHTLERAVVALNRGDQQRQQSVSVSGMGLQNGDVLTELIRGGTVTVSNNSITVTAPGKSACIYSLALPSPTPSPSRTPGSGTPTPTPTQRPSGTPGTATPTGLPTRTPTPTPAERTIDISTNQDMYEEGDQFTLTVEIYNSGNAVIVDLYVVLDVYGSYYFYPAWNQAAQCEIETLIANWRHDYTILDFVWPKVDSSADNITFWGAIIEHGATSVLSLDQTTFGWR